MTRRLTIWIIAGVASWAVVYGIAVGVMAALETGLG